MDFDYAAHYAKYDITNRILKTDPEPFEAVWRGEKRFEVRRNDRDFKQGDTIYLRQTLHSAAEMAEGAELDYTGSEVKCSVDYILYGPAYGIPEGFCVMSITPIERSVYTPS